MLSKSGVGSNTSLVGGHGGDDAPVEPGRLAARVARVDVPLPVREVLLQQREQRLVKKPTHSVKTSVRVYHYRSQFFWPF